MERSASVVLSVVTVVVVVVVVAVAAAQTLTEDHFDRKLECTKENTYGYAYLQFFPVDSLAGMEANASKAPKPVLYLEFYVKAEKNAYVLLTNAEERNVTWGYEILLGGAGNKISQIRLIEGTRKTVKYSKETRNILSHVGYAGFWVKMTTRRLITVGRIGSDVSFLFAMARNPVDVKYFAFSTWSNVRGVWYFNCTKSFDPDAARDDENVPAMRRLKKDLLSSYDPFEHPQKDGEAPQTVNVRLDANYFRLDEKRGELELRGTSHLRWTDWKLSWDPSDYGGVDVMYVTPFNVWTPVVHVMNSLSLRKRALLDGRAAVVVVGRNGEATWKTSFRSVTSCSLGYRNWPVDDHNCSLVFGFVTEPLDINVTEMVMPEVAEWDIDGRRSFASYVVDHTAKIDIRFRRRDFSAEMIMLPPFIGAAVLTLASFWVHPMSLAKLFLNCTSILILIVAGVGLANLVPRSVPSAPQIVVLHAWGAGALCVPILLFVALRYVPLSVAPPQPLRWLMSNALLCSCASDDRETESDTFGARQRREATAFDYVRLATFVERVVFVVYFAALVVPFAVCVAKLEHPSRAIPSPLPPIPPSAEE